MRFTKKSPFLFMCALNPTELLLYRELSFDLIKFPSNWGKIGTDYLSKASMPSLVAAQAPRDMKRSLYPGNINWPLKVNIRAVRPGNSLLNPAASVPKQQNAPEHRTPWGWLPNK
jgi:hypothetical protein